VEFRIASADDVRAIALLRWDATAEDGPAVQTRDDFATAFVEWAEAVKTTHTAFVAVDDGAVVGSAWLAQIPRAPDPGMKRRTNGDLQTVFVVPDRRNAGVGAALIRQVLAHGWRHGMSAVTVAANERAATFYLRLGFTGDPLDLRIAAPAQSLG
jgi:GNAT superfamily N-acetyltransferase